MTKTTQQIKDQLNEAWYAQAANKLGTDSKKAKELTDQALPLLWEKLAKNTTDKKGAADLTKALQDERHDGRILEANQDFFDDRQLDEGDKILKHILGETRDDITQALALETKTEPSQAKKTLAALSPLVMGALGQAVKSEKLNVEQVGSLFKTAVKERDFGKLSHNIAVLIWDKNKDGHYKDDWFNAAKSWLSGWLNKKD